MMDSNIAALEQKRHWILDNNSNDDNWQGIDTELSVLNIGFHTASSFAGDSDNTLKAYCWLLQLAMSP